MIRQQDSGGGGGMSVYDRVEPLQFITEMGKAFAHAGIAKTEPEGKVLALACLCERKTVFEIKRTYHLIEGNLSMRSEVMLAKFRQAGGKIRWIKTGDDGIEASLALKFKDEPEYVVSFTIDKAQKAGYVKAGSQWLKRPDQMLRARCSTDGVRMVAPEIIAGYYSPEELDDVQAAGIVSGAMTAAPIRPATEVAARRAELQGVAGTVSEGMVLPLQAERIIDAEVEPKITEPANDPSAAPTESAPFEVPGETDPAPGANAEYIRDTHLMQFQAACDEAGTTQAAVLVRITAQNKDITSVDDLTNENLATLAANLREKARLVREGK